MLKTIGRSPESSHARPTNVAGHETHSSDGASTELLRLDSYALRNPEDVARAKLSENAASHDPRMRATVIENLASNCEKNVAAAKQKLQAYLRRKIRQE